MGSGRWLDTALLGHSESLTSPGCNCAQSPLAYTSFAVWGQQMEWVIVGVIWWHTIWVVPCHLVCPPLPLHFGKAGITGMCHKCLAAWGSKRVEESLAWGLASHRKGDSVVLRLRSHAMVSAAVRVNSPSITSIPPTAVCEKIHLTPSNATAGKSEKQDI